MKKPYIKDYVKLRAFDSLGVQVGADIIFSNEEILGEIKELNTVSTTVLKTLAGVSASGVNLHPQGFNMTITMRPDRERTGTTYFKIDKLLEAIGLNYRIEFSLLVGRRLDDVALHTFLSYPVVWSSSVLEFDEQTQRQISLGVGLRDRTEFSLTVYKAVTLSLPQQPAAGSGSGAGTIGVGNIVLGNGTVLGSPVILFP